MINLEKEQVLDNVNKLYDTVSNSVIQLEEKASKNLTANIRDFGAIGDGITDDTVSIQKAINYLSQVPSVGGTVWIPYGKYKYTNVYITTPNINIDGDGILYNGTLSFGTSAIQDFSSYVRGISFDNIDCTKNAIEMQCTRRLFITNCKFFNCDKAVYVKPMVSAPVHGNSMIRIFGNDFIGVNYAFYVDKETSSSWMATADSYFGNNNINRCWIEAIHIEAIDGMTIEANTSFFPSYNESSSRKYNKKRNVYVGTSDWLHIKNNNWFEAGFEGVLLDNPKHIDISGNHIAWCGQLDLYSGIKITGSSYVTGSITNNTISNFTKHAIEILSNSENLIIGDNPYNFSMTSATYIGSTPIGSITHYRVYVGDSFSGEPIITEIGSNLLDDYIKNTKQFFTSRLSYASRLGVASNKTATVTSANTPIFNIVDANNFTDCWDGLVIIHARSVFNHTANTSTWLYYVSKIITNATVMTELHKSGLLSGGNTNHPSFTFSLDASNNKLLASPVGSTSGNFVFSITCIGNIQMK